jgi:hypothetical protein
MNEPLTHSTQAAWPEWHQQPLRLTVSEISNPALVIDQFFQCYHLADIRDCLTNWLQDALAKESIECKQHIATHDSVQKLIEAVWQINKTHWENYEQSVSNGEDKQNERYSKPERLVEKARKAPMEVLTEAFTHISVMNLDVALYVQQDSRGVF